jgi:hypothetical protein
MTSFRRLAVAAAMLALLAPAAARAAGVEALQPFPSNLLTVQDATQPTGLRVDLPKPNCAAYPSDCQDLDVLNGLDGFNIQPRITVPFSGAIDLATVSSGSIHLFDTSCLVCAPLGIDQTVWEPAADALHFESGSLLKEDTTYLLVVTTGVHSADGTPLDRTTFLHDLNFGQTKDPKTKAYRKALKAALDQVGEFTTAAVASLFTTQTATDELAAIRDQLDASTPAPATIEASVPLAGLTGIDFVRQTGASPPTFSPIAVPVTALGAIPGAVGRIVFGSYVSPQYETADRVIPAVPAVQSTERIEFELFLPSSPVPAGGYPVALFGHGFGDNKNNSPYVVAASMAAAGIATVAINVVGHGFGPLGTLVVHTVPGNITVPAGGRGIDQNGNHVIDSTEGVNAAPPYTLVGNRDGLRQTVVDLMQLVRVIRSGGVPDLSTSRIYYFGQSFGGIYGTELLGTDPDIRAGVPNVPGGSIIEVARLGGFRPLVGIALLSRVPSLYNTSPPNAPLYTNFVENIPLRGRPILVDTVPGASAIQEAFDRNEWAQQAGSPVPYARLIDPAKVIVQFAKGDQTVPNPTASALIRAGGLESRATYFRNDLAFAISSTFTKNPHTFLTRLSSPLPAVAALEAQAQIATFFATDGAVTIDPDGAQPLFETPIAGPLPEDLNFIP